MTLLAGPKGTESLRYSIYCGFPSVSLIFHHHSAIARLPVWREGKGNRPHPEFPGQNLGPSAQFKNGPSTWLALDLELIPGDSPADPGSQCLRSRLFGGETGGEAFRTGSLAAAVRDLMICVNRGAENARRSARSIARYAQSQSSPRLSRSTCRPHYHGIIYGHPHLPKM